MHPLRPRLADLLTVEIREGINQSKWTGWLPQERMMSAELNVSRATLRQALKRLEHDGIIKCIYARGYQIVRRTRATVQSLKKRYMVNLILPGERGVTRIEGGMPWLGLIRQQLATVGHDMRVLEVQSCYSREPARALERLRKHYPADCWVIKVSTRPMQEWFKAKGIPTVVAGTCYPGIALPGLDVDRRAICRHAVFKAASFGHRHVVLILDGESRGGDIESEQGFGAAVTETKGRHPEFTGSIMRHSGTVTGLVRQLDRLFNAPIRPTAMLVTQPMNYLSIVGYLSSHSISVPDKVSLIGQVEAPFFSYMLPRPACYRVDVPRFGKLLLRSIIAVIEQHASASNQRLVMPEFVPGGSFCQFRERAGAALPGGCLS